jgi:hypothetical protein
MPAEEGSFSIHTGKVDSDALRELSRAVASALAAVPPERRPWAAAGVELHIRGKDALRADLLVVSPAQVTLGLVFELPGIARGDLVGDPNLKQWRVETPDGRHAVWKDASPFHRGRELLYTILPHLDRFLHERREKNPYVHCLLIFPDGYSLEGVREVPRGPNARGPISVVTLSAVAEALFVERGREEVSGRVLREWIESAIPQADDRSFVETFLAPAYAGRSETATTSRPPGQEREERASEEVETEEWILAESGAAKTSRRQDFELEGTEEATRRSAGRRKRRWLAFGLGGLGAILIALLAWQLYEFSQPALEPLSPAQTARAPASPPPPSPAPASPDAPPATEPPAPQESETPGPAAEKAPVPSAAPPERREPRSDLPASRPERPEPRREPPVETAAIRRAEPGIYETIRPTAALSAPSAGAAIVDRLRPGTRVNVVGSEGEYLVVRSRTKNARVYVRREDAMFLPGVEPGGYEKAEAAWKEIELKIREALAQRGITGVSVSFIGDTAYLRGRVRSDRESEDAELAARSFPEVKHVHNGIWVEH